jgi:hypothetical protein
MLQPSLIALALAWGSGLTLSAIWFVLRIIRNKRDQELILRSLSWPEVRGTVVESKPIRGRVETTYEYAVGGQRLTGKYVVNLATTVPASLPPEAGRRLKSGNRERLSEFPPGQPVIVRYNPLLPSESVFFCKSPGGQEIPLRT